jgi:hypothetical protein
VNAKPHKVRWAKRVSPLKIRQLYESDAQGMLDRDLVDDVGYGIYVRCQESLELARACRGRVKCRDCGTIILRRLVDGQFDATEMLRCPACGWEIAPGDYHKSLLRNRPAPPYEPLCVYHSFVEQWPLARSPREKLLLVDHLIHAWHLHYRAVGWPLGTDVVQATAKQMVTLLEELAYGPGSTEGLEKTRRVWRSRLEARQLVFDLEEAARELGIVGASRMRKRELIEAIERADPTYFEPWLKLVYGEEQTALGQNKELAG